MIDRLVGRSRCAASGIPRTAGRISLELTAAGKKTNHRNGRRLGEAIERLRDELEGDPEEILAALRLLEDGLRKLLES